jgi:hypothetical protein
MDKLVTIATFDFPAEAEFLKNVLEEEDIPAFLADNNDSLLSLVDGGVKLKVADCDADRAREILARNRSSSNIAANEGLRKDISFACEDCGNTISFPAERRGGVEVCPFCKHYVDVPEGLTEDANSDDSNPA